MIYTSRYGNKGLNDEEHWCVGISLGKPKFPIKYTIREQCYLLAPKGNMLKMPYDLYKPAYMQKLTSFGEEKVIRVINSMNKLAYENDKDLVLLCFEDVRKPGVWCHRTMFAEWWMNHTGEKIEELMDPSELSLTQKKPAVDLPKPEFEQMTLF